MSNFQPRGGDLLGRYELLLPIAKGGMAEVWLARLSGSRGFKKTVAIKTILRGSIDEARMEQMFIEEATLASQLHHPNTVDILDFGEHQGTLFIVMEWVEGEPLNVIVAEAMKRGGLPLAIAVNVIGQVCKGLHAAHELCDETGNSLGLVHRDISPQNIIVSYTGTAKVLDFGIAKATSQVSSLTEVGEVKGKFAYMSPEQVAGHALDRRSDVFSLGVLAYLLTTGRHPFRGENSAETVHNIHSEQAAAPPSSFLPEYHPGLERAIMRAIEKNPDARWLTAHDFLLGLMQALPDCLEGTFEVTLAAYMMDLFGARQAERRRQLRLVDERNGKEASGLVLLSRSQGSLGAVSIDGGPTSAALPEVGAALESASISALTGLTPRSRRFALGAVALVSATALVTLGFTLSRAVDGSTSDPAARAAATLGPEAGVPVLPAPAATVAAAPLRAAPPPVVSVHPAAEPAAPPPAKASRDARTTAARSGPTKSAPRAPVAAAPPPAPSATAAAAPAARPSAASSARTNSWDPSTFGGRY